MYHSEEQLQRYLKQHNVHEVLVAIAESICLEQPTDVPTHIIQFLQKHFVRDHVVQKPQVSKPIQPSQVQFNDTIWKHSYDTQTPRGEENGFAPFTFGNPNAKQDDTAEDEDVEIDLEASENIRRRYSVIDRRGGVSNESLDSKEAQTIQVPGPKKSLEEKLRIKYAIQHNALFAALDDDELDKLFDVMDSVSFQPGETIIQQGDEGELFYIIDNGSVEIYKDDKLLSRIGEAGGFGELALIHGTPRAATVKASKDGCKCWTINRLTFRRVLMDATTQKRKKYESFLKKVRILETLDDYERMTIADALESDTWQRGETIVTQGEPGNTFYIIVEGSVDIHKTNEQGEVIKLGSLGEGDYFGEIALLLDQPRAATVTVSEDCEQVKTVRLDRRSFKSLLGNIEDLLKRNLSLYNQFVSTQI